MQSIEIANNKWNKYLQAGNNHQFDIKYISHKWRGDVVVTTNQDGQWYTKQSYIVKVSWEL